MIEAILNIWEVIHFIFEQMFRAISMMGIWAILPMIICLTSLLFGCISGIHRSKRARQRYERKVYDTCEMVSNVIDIAKCAANSKSRKG